MTNISPGVLKSKSGGWDLPNHQQSTSKRDSQMTNEEFRHCVYNQFKCGMGFKNDQERCYEILNEKRNTQSTNRRYSQYEHHYKIKW